MWGPFRGRRSPSCAPLVLAACVAGAAAASGACGTRESRIRAAAPPAPVRVLGSVAYVPGTLKVDGEALSVGSLSGLAFDARTGHYVAASDSLPPRLVWLDVKVPLDVTPLGITTVHAAPGLAHPEVLPRLDMESLVAMPDGSFMTTHEGHTDREGIARQSALLHVTRDGAVDDVAFPHPHFHITAGDLTAGVRHNLGLESLTRTPDDRLLSGLEQPLAQDGPISTPARGGRVRLLEFVRAGRGWTPGREWAYDLDATPLAPGYERVCDDGQNGLSEMLAVDTHRFIALERACLLGAPGAPALNPVRLYLVDVDGADDVSAFPALGDREVRPAAKRLLVDLLPLRAGMHPLLQPVLSNFEGLAVGPPIPGRARSLLLVSDDNFRATQTTAFLWLSLGLSP